MNVEKKTYGTDTEKMKERATSFGDEIDAQTEKDKKVLEKKTVDDMLKSMKQKKQVRSHLRRDIERFDREEIKKVTKEILKEQAKKAENNRDSTI